MEGIRDAIRRPIEQRAQGAEVEIPRLYRHLEDWPPSWESPIEKSLWLALRHIGLTVETQVRVGAFRLDMVVSSRLNPTRVIVECDGAEYHHDLIDEFRDDELIELTGYPIAHMYGWAIARSPEQCATFIVENWCPEHKGTLGYAEALEVMRDARVKHITGAKRLPIGRLRTNDPGQASTFSDNRMRQLVRYLVGNAAVPNDWPENEREFISELRRELQMHKLLGRKLSPAELSRAYILVAYSEPYRSQALAQLDQFLMHREDPQQ